MVTSWEWSSTTLTTLRSRRPGPDAMPQSRVRTHSRSGRDRHREPSAKHRDAHVNVDQVDDAPSHIDAQSRPGSISMRKEQ
jgi:hypothetical protein